MQYTHLRSLFNTKKQSIPLQHEDESFRIHDSDNSIYIQPTIEKVMFENEKPSIILVSAVGATGKTALAKQLSIETQLPVLDLGTHRPVGGHSLTGLITESFDILTVSSVLHGLRNGTFGIIIDGIDEGRSKTTEEAFRSFLANLTSLCGSCECPVFIILGRTAILEDCWMYLTGAGIDAALVTIEPFSVKSAKLYIDAFSQGSDSSHAVEYTEVRDTIIDKLGAVFSVHSDGHNPEFLAFLGYPPVLDSIVTLLKGERNYHGLIQSLDGSGGQDIEVTLLFNIATYILDRERKEKVIPNIVEPLVNGTAIDTSSAALEEAFGHLEQCVRLVAHCLGEQVTIMVFEDYSLQEQYEEQLSDFFLHHPFLDPSKPGFRNPVFEALALSVLMTAGNRSYEDLANKYAASRKSSYHLIYMLDAISSASPFDSSYVKNIVDAAMEFRSVHSTVEIQIDGQSWEEVDECHTAWPLELSIDIVANDSEAQREIKTFEFESICTVDTIIELGPRLAGAFISIPCELVIRGETEVELTAPIAISARKLRFESPRLVLHSTRSRSEDLDMGVLGDCEDLGSSLREIVSGGCLFQVRSKNSSGLGYPIHQYVQRRDFDPRDPDLEKKFLRLKRILLEFRSHSRGSLARFRGKIDSQRVLKNEIGRRVLDALLRDGVMYIEGNFYFLDPNRLHECLGVSWPELRNGQASAAVVSYLKQV